MQKHEISRRAFLQQTLAAGGSLVLPASATAAAAATDDRPPTGPAGSEPPWAARPGTEGHLVDRRWVEHTYFLTRKVMRPERFSDEPVIPDTSRGPVRARADTAAGAGAEREDEGTVRVSEGRGRDPGWGGEPASAMGTVLPTKDGLALWYVSPYRVEEPGGKLIGYDSVVRYAVSRNGRDFELPRLGLCSFRGSRENNIVLGLDARDSAGVPLTGPRGCSGFSVIDATLGPAPHARGRYTAMYRTSVPRRGAGLYLAWSDDGLRWHAYPENPVTAGSDTFCNVVCDPRTQRYALYTRPSPAAHGLRAGPAGVRSLMSRLESRDLLTWDGERVVFDTDEADAPARGTVKLGAAATETARGRDVVCYGLTVTPQSGGFLGVAQIYDGASGAMWCELAHSVDGVDWRREPRREPFIPVGPAGAWDSGMVSFTAAGCPAAVGDDWFFYYTGTNWTHHFNVTALPERGRMWQIGGVRARRGRLVGYATGASDHDAAPTGKGRGVAPAWANRGELLTRPFRLEASALRLNADARAGRITVALCGEDGRPLAGCSAEDAVPLQADGIRLPVTFRGGAPLAALRGRTLRLRVYLESAAIFGLSFD